MDRRTKAKKLETIPEQPHVTLLGRVVIATDHVVPGFPQITYIGHATTTDCRQNFRPPEPVPRHGRFWLCLEGQARVEEDGQSNILGPGEGFIVESDHPTINCFCESESQGLEFIVVFFKGESILDKIHHLVERYGRFQRVPVETSIIQRFLSLTLDRSDEQSIQMTCSDSVGLTWSLFRELIHSHEQDIDSSPSAGLAREARDLMRDAVKEHTSVTEVAASLGVSREHMTRVFQQHFGTSPHRYLSRLKIERACMLLKETTLPHKAIASSLGFQSRNTFYQLFKRTMGMTPDRYRRTDQGLW